MENLWKVIVLVFSSSALLFSVPVEASRGESITWARPSGQVMLKMTITLGTDRSGAPVKWVRWTARNGEPLNDLRQIESLRRAFESAVLRGRLTREQRVTTPNSDRLQTRMVQRGMMVTLQDGRVRFSLSASGRARLKTARGIVTGKGTVGSKILGLKDVRYMVDALKAAAPWRSVR